MRSGLVSFGDDDPRRWQEQSRFDGVDTSWTNRVPGRAPAPGRRAPVRGGERGTGSNVAAHIRASEPDPEPEPESGPSDGTLALVAVAAGVSVVAVIGVGIVGIGVVAASLAKPPAVPMGTDPTTASAVHASPATPSGRSLPAGSPFAGDRGSVQAPAARPTGAGPQGGGWSGGASPALPAAGAAADGSADGWFGGVVAAGSEMVSRVVGEPPPPPSLGGVVGRPAASPAAPGAAAPLVADDGLRDLGAEPKGAGWTASAPADDAAVALLAELDAPGLPSRAGLPSAGALPHNAALNNAALNNAALNNAALPHASPPSAPPSPGAAPTADAPADDGWFDALLTAGAGVANAITGQSAPPPSAPARPPPPSLAAAIRPEAAPPDDGGDLLADDGLTAIGRQAERAPPSSADEAAMALLAELDRDLPARAPVLAPATGAGGPPPAPPAPAPAADDTSWLDAVVDAGSALRSFVTGEPTAPVAAAPPPTRDPNALVLPAVPGGTSGAAAARPGLPARDAPLPGAAPAAPAGPVDLLAGDDGLGTLGGDRSVADATGGFGSAAAADDPALALLAELDREAARPLPPGTPGARAAAEPPPAPAGEDLSWLDAVSSVGSAISDGLSGLVGGGGGPSAARPDAPQEAGPWDPALGREPSLDGLVSDLSADRPSATSNGGPRAVDPASRAALDGVAAGAPSAARPSAEDAGWFDALLDAGSDLVSNALGAEDPGLVPSAPSVDLLADDDGLGSLPDARTADRTDGFGTSAAADDPALALLAELDAPSTRPAPGAAPTATDPAANALVSSSFAAPSAPPAPAPFSSAPGYAAPPSLASVGVGVATSGASAARTGTTAASWDAPSAAAPPPPVAADTSWLDAITTQVSSLVSGPSTTSAARPTPMAPATAGGRAAPQTDLLAGDDGLGSLVADLSRDEDGWQRGSAPDDAALALLAELDAPRAGAPAPRTAPGAPAAVPEPEDSWFDSVVAVGSAIASYVSGTEGLSPAPSAPAGAAGTPQAAPSSGPSLASLATFLTSEPVPVAAASAPRPAAPRSAGRPVDLLADGDTNLVALGDTPVDTRPVDQWVNPTLGTRSAEAAVATGLGLPAPAPRPCAEGELCDKELWTYRDDPGTGTDLLAQDDLFVGPLPLQGDEPVVAELFGGSDEAGDDRSSAGMFSMGNFLLIVNTDVPGVPIEIDGKRVGEAPLVTEVKPGPHRVRLIGGGDTVSEFTLRVDADPQEWCFQGRGRQFRYVRCP